MTKKIGFFLGMMTLLATTASALPTYQTTGTFGSAGTCVGVLNVLTCGTTIFTFTGTGPDSVNAPATANYGHIDTVATGSQAVAGSFTLSVFQSLPVAGVGNLLGSLTGNLSSVGGITTLTFGTPSVVIQGYLYSVNSSYSIAGPSTGLPAGRTTLQGTITPVSVPDSGTALMLLGSAFLGLGALRRKINL